MKNKLIAAVIGLSVVGLAGCETDATVASRNLAKSAEMFELMRRIVFYNGITGEYMLSIEGRCSIDDQQRQLEVTCKEGARSFKKHHLGLSDNVTYFSEQLGVAEVSTYHHRVIFKPQSILPNIDINGDVEQIKDLIRK